MRNQMYILNQEKPCVSVFRWGFKVPAKIKLCCSSLSVLDHIPYHMEAIYTASSTLY